MTAPASSALGGTGRWSARRKVSVVIEFLKEESLEILSRRHGVTAAKLSQWRDHFLAGGEARLKLIFRDNASGGRWDRPELHTLLSQLRKGDVLVVWTLDRLSRSLRDVLTIMERVQERHAGFRSLKEAVDTTTPAGRMMMQMVGAFAEFERAMLKERTKPGLDAARKEGRIGGRPPKLKPHQQQEIVALVKQGKKTAADAARLFGVHPATVSRLLRRT